MANEPLEHWLRDLRRARIAVIGDFCLDVYWALDLSASEISLETGVATTPGRGQRYSLGGAGNVISNLAALGVGAMRAFAVVGDDPFGRELSRLLGAMRVDLTGVVTQGEQWDTPTYIKPILEDREQSRIDFGNYNSLDDAVAEELLSRLRDSLVDLDIVIVNQQLMHGIHTPFLRRELAMLMEEASVPFIVDSRNFSDAYPACYHKLNDLEAVRLWGREADTDDVISRADSTDAARDLALRWGYPVFLTRGSKGCIVADHTGTQAVPGLHIVGRTDPVGAGDSMLAGVATALAVGSEPFDAATFGNSVAGVTVQKLYQTGTATADEVRAIGTSPDYVYNPELADDPRSAVMLENTSIELVNTISPDPCVTHAVFDHDGTLSTLRQGWEGVMEPTMVEAIMGASYHGADETTYARVVRRVREFIDKTTGIQTLSQMLGLVEMVQDFGLVPTDEILDEHGYKRIYNDRLMALVDDRVRQLERGELGVEDFTVKNAPALLHLLARSGVKLYLASGTDEADVVREAEALGYGSLFEGRVYGAVGDVTKEAKRIVLDRILEDIGPGQLSHVVTFGDGPVEIRETRKRGGIPVGVASDEVRRFGLNASKRARLIRAGAAAIVPDFSQMSAVLGLLGLAGPADPGR